MNGYCTGGIERQHALGMSNGYWHQCREYDEPVMAFPDTNGRLRCARCGAFCKTSTGITHVDVHPIRYSERYVDTDTEHERGDR